MPPLKQPKDLSYLCYSSFSISIAKVVYRYMNQSQRLTTELGSFFAQFPAVLLENLYLWIIPASTPLIQSGDRDDIEIVREQCEFIITVLKVLLQSKIRNLEQNFVIDLRLFQNFCFFEAEQNEEESDVTEKIKVSDESITDIYEVSLSILI